MKAHPARLLLLSLAPPAPQPDRARARVTTMSATARPQYTARRIARTRLVMRRSRHILWR